MSYTLIAKKYVAAALIAVACAPLAVLGAEAVEKAASEPMTPVSRIDVFDGESLRGFYTWLSDSKYDDPKQVFRVTDGMLHVTGDGFGCVTTNASYRDYHMVLEYKWGERTWGDRKDNARDSGILFHSNGSDGGYGGNWMPSIEANIIEGGVGDFIVVKGDDDQGASVPLAITCRVRKDRDEQTIWDKAGKLETINAGNWHRVNWFARDPDWKDERGYRGAHDLDSPGSEWTRLDVVCNAGHIQVFVNGTLANEAFDAQPQSGRLQLQSELAELFVRRWELWPLSSAPKPAAAEQSLSAQ